MRLCITGFFLLGGCYNSTLVHTVDYGLSRLPERERSARFSLESTHLAVTENGAEHRLVGVFVDRPQWHRMRNWARQQERIYPESHLTVYFFACDLGTPDLARISHQPSASRPNLGSQSGFARADFLPDYALPFVAGVYSKRGGKATFFKDRSAFERAQHHYATLSFHPDHGQ